MGDIDELIYIIEREWLQRTKDGPDHFVHNLGMKVSDICD